MFSKALLKLLHCFLTLYKNLFNDTFLDKFFFKLCSLSLLKFPVPYHCLLHYSTFGNINKNRDFKCKKYVSLSLLIFAFVSSGKAAVPLAFTVTLQSILSWTGDPLHSITNEGLCIDGQAGSLCLFCCHNTVWPLFLKHQSKCISSYFLQSGFRNHNAPWKSALISVQKRNGSQVASSISLASTVKDKTISRKRVWKSV